MSNIAEQIIATLEEPEAKEIDQGSPEMALYQIMEIRRKKLALVASIVSGVAIVPYEGNL